MIDAVLLTAALIIASTTTSMMNTYQDCVQTFAFAQIRSGENAETLVSAGEAECRREREDLKSSIRDTVSDEVNSLPDAKYLSQTDLEPLIDNAVNERASFIVEAVRELALRNVVFVKARLNEMESQGASNP